MKEKKQMETQLLEPPPPPYHVLHKLPAGDSPYVRAKHVQLVDKDLEAAIGLFWKAIKAGDRIDSELKDMSVVMKQQDIITSSSSLTKKCSPREFGNASPRSRNTPPARTVNHA
ncbi:hypothetical protein HRI_000063500 [Hibiscus trionum]|uniref:Uncharacterized protein n=1 Tax=Hibiscus trionum TaxID=183268 RepID=A0A9W7GRW7_HIBTR|nr:hypothetical protein HRI_000063500 [Hibiscus trionum]